METSNEKRFAVSERSLQNALYRDLYARRHNLIAPNVDLFGWECDLVSVTPTNLICEYEIKCTRSDFKADFNKEAKHSILRLRASPEQSMMPAYFYYAVPRDLIDKSEVPDYAGLIYVYPVLQYIKKAPRLHREKITESHVRRIHRGLMYRFWRERLAVTDKTLLLSM